MTAQMHSSVVRAPFDRRSGALKTYDQNPAVVHESDYHPAKGTGLIQVYRLHSGTSLMALALADREDFSDPLVIGCFAFAAVAGGILSAGLWRWSVGGATRSTMTLKEGLLEA
jgi:RNase P/RNase MRP subunit POP5